MSLIEQTLKNFSAAWAGRDLEAVVNLFATEGEYAASVGPDPGKTARGHDEIRALVKDMFAVDDGAVAENSIPIVFGEEAFWTWTYHMPDGSVQSGCDFLRMRNGKIILKDAYRKVTAVA